MSDESTEIIVPITLEAIEKINGRPTVMTLDVLKKLQEAFLMGATDIQACQAANISRRTFYLFIKEHPDFRDTVEEMRENVTQKAKQLVGDIIINGSDKISESERLNLTKWYLERKAKDEFGEQKEVQKDNTYSELEAILTSDTLTLKKKTIKLLDGNSS